MSQQVYLRVNKPLAAVKGSPFVGKSKGDVVGPVELTPGRQSLVNNGDVSVVNKPKGDN